jgi:hypothetical protein
MTLTLTDILHIRQVAGLIEARSMIEETLTPAQQAKVDSVETLLGEVGAPTVDDELDAMIAALTEIRDRP